METTLIFAIVFLNIPFIVKKTQAIPIGRFYVFLITAEARLLKEPCTKNAMSLYMTGLCKLEKPFKIFLKDDFY